MRTLTKHFPVLLYAGFLVTLSAAFNTCPGGLVNETLACANTTTLTLSADPCNNTFQDYACSNVSVLAALPNNLLVNLSSCYNNNTLPDSLYSALLFWKLDDNKTSAVLSQLRSKISNFGPAWSKLLLDGIWPRITQNLNGSNTPQPWISSDVQPFLLNVKPNMVQCLQDKNVSCAVFQELVKNLDLLFPNMTDGNRQQLYPSLRSFLQSRQRLSGWACSQNVNTSSWLQQNLAKFMQFANYSDFTALNANFSALDVLSLLTLPQIATFSLDANSSAAIMAVSGTLHNTDDVYNFLGYINAAAMSRNVSALRPPMAQALLNKTFEAIKPNISVFTLNQWTQLFQDKLTVILPEITPDQLSLIPQNISCGSYQTIMKGLDSTFNQMSPGKPQNIYSSFMKPFLKKSGPACSQNSNSSNFLTQNFGTFSQFADYSDFVAFNGNFSALDVLPVLTLQQKVNFSLGLNVSSDPMAAASVVGTLQNTNDLYDFLTYLNTSIVSKNMSSVFPALSQALLNKTFEAVKANMSMFNSSDWAQLFLMKLGPLLPEISSQQLGLIPQNISCGSYQVILKSLDNNFPKMSPWKQQDVYNSLVKPYLTKQGSACAQNVNSSALIRQNYGQFFQFANYKEFVALNKNFSAADVLSSLTMPQIIDFSLDPTINATVAAGIASMIQNISDGTNFLNCLKVAASLNNVSSLSPPMSQAVLTKTFQLVKPFLNFYSNLDWTDLFQDKLSLVLPEITKDQLNLIPKTISCASYRPIFNSLQSSFAKMKPANQADVYNSFIKPYLKKQGNVITCYNQTEANASAWLVNNMGSFMAYTSQEDLVLFANDSMLQTFANDPSCVQLARQLNFSKDAAIYFTSLLTASPSFNLSSLPDTFLCFLTPSALKNLNAQASLDLTKKMNKQCYNITAGQSAPTPEDVQVAISLVSKLNNFSSDTLVNLGQSAVGLSPGQINTINASDLQSSLSSLGNVSGWNVGQTRAILAKLLSSNYQIQNLGSLGSLVTGLPSKKLQELDPASVLNAVRDPQFASKLSSAPPALQNIFVKQIVAVNSTSSSVIKNVPANLASFIPKSLLLFKSEKPSLQDVNGKSWSPDQASMFFDDLASTTTNYTQLSSSVLQGFTCATPSKISNDQVKMLGKAMKTQSAALSEDQLNCLSRQITKSGYPTDLDSYPNDVYLFLNSANYSSIGNCTQFVTNVGKANISVLSKGSRQRSNLLASSLSCLNVSGSSLTDGNIQVLGQLSCDLNASLIASSSPSILTQLSQCPSFTTEQQAAIQTLLGKPNSVFGAPSTWTKDTLNSLGKISGFLTKDILTNISSVSFQSWMKNAVGSSTLTRSQFATIVQNLTPARARRAAACSSGKQITADNVNDNLLPLSYTAAELDACLDNDTLVNFLSVLSSKTFTNDQLTVLKNKLDALYPGGYPETILTNLGAITLVCGDADVSKWNITSVDTLSSLLAVGLPDSLAKSIIAKYISSGNQLTGPALNVIGSQICFLSSAQLNLINSTSISDAKALDVSGCNQTVKDALYLIANVSYQGQSNQVSTYFILIKPYVGGAPSADLKSLAVKGPNMDIGTFVQLNPSSVLSLTVNDVKGLLGNNTADLKTQESNSVVSSWIKLQRQSDLDTLGIGLQGGQRDSVTSNPTSTTAATTRTSSSASALTHGLSILLAVSGLFLLF